MSSLTSVVPKKNTNDPGKPPGKGAPHEGRTKSSGDYPSADRVLGEGADHQQVGLEGLRVVRWRLLKLFGRIERFGEQIDEAFAGQPFIPGLSPLHPINRRRFEAFLHEQKQITNLLGRALELWMLTCRLKQDNDWIPRNHRNTRLKKRKRQRAPQD